MAERSCQPSLMAPAPRKLSVCDVTYFAPLISAACEQGGAVVQLRLRKYFLLQH